MLKMSSISDLKRPTAPKILDSVNAIMQRTANENAAGLPRICKRSDQPMMQGPRFQFGLYHVVVLLS